MKKKLVSNLYVLIAFIAFWSCKKQETPAIVTPVTPVVTVPKPFIANPNPNWKVGDRFFLKGNPGDFDGVSVKDPSIVFSDGKWHLFYTGKDSSKWRMGYATAPTIAELKTAKRTYLSALNGGSYFCAPQVFYHSTKRTWFLIYQSSLGATYSTNTDINNPNGWSSGTAMGFTDGIDFWCISDDTKVYCFYSAQNGTRYIRSRFTKKEDFPFKWSEPVVTATETFEACHIYKNKTDSNYYMMVEDINRHFELWQTSNLGGTWAKASEKWAAKSNLTESGEHWTDQVSHGEIIRSGVNERCEIDDINKCEVLIQGVVSGNYPNYGLIPYDLGLIKNY